MSGHSAEHAGVVAETMQEGYTVKKGRGGGAKVTTWLVFLRDDAVSVEVQ